MKSIARSGALGIAFLIGCHSGTSHGPGTPCPCRAPLVCVQGLCEIADGAADDRGAASEAGDAAQGGTGGNGSGGTGGVGGIGGNGSSGTGGYDGGGGTGGTGGTSDSPDGDASAPVDAAADWSGDAPDAPGAGPDVSDSDAFPPPVLCATPGVVSCATSTSACAEAYCGRRLWAPIAGGNGGTITYRIRDPNGLLSNDYKAAIRASAGAWSTATGGFLSFVECTACTGRFVSVMPGEGDGVFPARDSMEEILPVPVDPSRPTSIPMHRIAHQWGHVIGLDDAYRRPDRDLHVTFDPKRWCADGATLPATCAFAAAPTPGSPRIAGGTFGAYDERSKMNGLPADGVCSSIGPDESSFQPTVGDVAAVRELYFSLRAGWTPFQPVGYSLKSGQQPDSELAPGVEPVGGPAIAKWFAPAVEIAARGSNSRVYAASNELSGTAFVQWSRWTIVADGTDADPALAFSGPQTLHLVVRAAIDGAIRLRTRKGGSWGASASLGAPASGAASAPAIAALNESWLSIVVRGGDKQIYLLTCTDPEASCAASAAAPGAWTALPTPPVDGFKGKPSTAWAWLDNGRELFVSAVGTDNAFWVISERESGWSSWQKMQDLSLAPDDPEPGIAATAAAVVAFFARDDHGLVEQANISVQEVNGPGALHRLGGVLDSAPAAATSRDGSFHYDIVGIVNDHGRRGVWWKFIGDYRPVCNYNAPGTCAQCGCGTSAAPCDR
jgi:hypothetical protein